MKFAQIIVFKKVGEFDDELTYQIPEALAPSIREGVFAEIPFRNQKAKGIVVGVLDELPGNLTADKIREITGIIPSVGLPSEQIQLVRFISTYYRTSLARALKLLFPKMLWEGKLTPPTRLTYRLLQTEPVLRGEKAKLIYDFVRQNGGTASSDDLKNKLDGFSAPSLKTLIKNGVVEEAAEPFFQPFNLAHSTIQETEKVLTDYQKQALMLIRSTDKPILIHGITGSGKTEIYLHQIISTIRSGKQAVLLVPEIALTPQTIRYFKDYLGEHIAVFHSQLSDGERAREWWKVKSGFAPLVIGSRSAIFAPVTNLGLIILDEEHEWTYKQESAPYYETHRVAEEMQKIWKATLILGSATPKAESYQKTRTGEYAYFHLPERILQSDLPVIHVVDLRAEFKKRNFSVLSLMLQLKIKERLEKNEQIILFVNQRGLSNAVVCRDCGYTEKCPHCEIALKYHRSYQDSGFRIQDSAADRLVCHYCQFTKAPELLCPNCRSPYIRHIGVGTQRVEEEVKKLFPKARVVRADRDTTQNGEGFSPIYHDFLEHKYDVLIGTQMVAKGLDFGNVSLIGIVLADIGLHLPDFRSSERLFQILTQVAGRCGRRERAGEVVLQTYNPDHPTIQKAAQYRYPEFMEGELKARGELGYPPFNRMIKFTVVGSDATKLSEHIRQEQEVLEDLFKINGLDVRITSAPALVPKVADRYYYHVLLRSKDPQIVFKHWKTPKGWRVDVDPVHTT